MKRSTFGYSYLATFFVIVLGSVLLFCVRSSKLQSWKWLIFGDLILVALPSILVGVALVFLVDYLQLRQARKRLNAIQNRSIYNPKYGRPTDEVAVMPDIQVSDTASSANSILLESIVIKNFRNIQELRLNFRRPSTLLGEWTCIAGINGAGKTTILQAICLVLLGEESVNEFGKGRLGRMLRRSSSGTADAEIEAVVLYGGERTQLYLPLKREGSGEAAVDMDALRSNSKHSEMLKAWASLRKQVLVGYGASRNVSDVRDSRNSHLSRIAQRQMTLFDPLTQLASVNIILEGTKDVRPVIETLHQLIPSFFRPKI